MCVCMGMWAWVRICERMTVWMHYRGAVHADGYQEAGLDMDQPGTDSYFQRNKLEGGCKCCGGGAGVR